MFVFAGVFFWGEGEALFCVSWFGGGEVFLVGEGFVVQFVFF